MKIEIDRFIGLIMISSIIIIGIFFTLNNQAHTNLELDISNELIAQYFQLLDKDINLTNSSINGYTHIKIDADYSLFDIVKILR